MRGFVDRDAVTAQVCREAKMAADGAEPEQTTPDFLLMQCPKRKSIASGAIPASLDTRARASTREKPASFLTRRASPPTYAEINVSYIERAASNKRSRNNKYEIDRTGAAVT